MNHNPYKIQIGDNAILDNQYIVKVVEFTPLCMYAFVEYNNGESIHRREVMTNRLTPYGIVTSNDTTINIKTISNE